MYNKTTEWIEAEDIIRKTLCGAAGPTCIIHGGQDRTILIDGEHTNMYIKAFRPKSAFYLPFIYEGLPITIINYEYPY